MSLHRGDESQPPHLYRGCTFGEWSSLGCPEALGEIFLGTVGKHSDQHAAIERTRELERRGECTAGRNADHQPRFTSQATHTAVRIFSADPQVRIGEG